MMLKGMGQTGPTDEQLGIPPGASNVLAGSYPVGSVGDQFQTCVSAGGDPASCAAAVIEENPTAGGGVAASGPGMIGPCSWYQDKQPNGTCKTNSVLIAGLLALGFVGVMKFR